MIKIFPTYQIKQLDAYTIEHEPIASIDLMERAARALTDEITRRWTPETPFVFMAGPGNNGGDALAVARLMSEKGYQTSVYLFNTKGKLSPDCEQNKECLLAVRGVDFHEVISQFTPPVLNTETVVVDGLFGSGLNKPLEGGFASVVKYINASKAEVVSIDVPSGLMGEENGENKSDCIIKASLTLSLQLPKLAFLFAENEEFVGEWMLLDIGLSKQAIDEMPTPYKMLTDDDIPAMLKPRGKHTHKGNYGRAMLIAGSQGMAGASILAARACLRSGVGLLTVHLPFYNNLIMQMAVPEAMTEIDINDAYFAEATDVDDFQAVAIGPGLARSRATEMAVLEQISTTQIPMVIDADALNILGDNKTYLMRLPKGSILTPHVKELERLVGKCNDSHERLMRAIELAERAEVYIVLKGAYSAIISPKGEVYFSSRGNPGMATGGCGDVLTGILLALLAQGYDTGRAALMGVYIHGLAGDLSAEKFGQIAMTSGDLVEMLPQAWKAIGAK